MSLPPQIINAVKDLNAALADIGNEHAVIIQIHTTAADALYRAITNNPMAPATRARAFTVCGTGFVGVSTTPKSLKGLGFGDLK